MAQTLRAEVARTYQVGIESAFGGGGNETLKFPTVRFEPPKINKNMKLLTPSSYKVPTKVVGGKESSTIPFASEGIGYDELVYFHESGIKTVTPTGSTHKARVITPTVNAQDTRKSLTSGWGQTGDLWKANGGFTQKMSLKSDLNGLSFGGELMHQQLTIPSSLYATPTEINNRPILVEEVGLFEAASFAALAQWKLIIGTQSSGSFTLTYGGASTAAIAFGANAAAIDTALELLASIGASGVTVTGAGTTGDPFIITVADAKLGGTMTGTFTALENPGNASVGPNSTAIEWPIEAELVYDPLLAAVMRLKQGEASYAGTVEVAPGWAFNLTVARDQSSQELNGTVWTLANWRAGTQKFVRWQAKSQTADEIVSGYTYQHTVDMCLIVGEPFELGEFEGLSIIKFPCRVAADSSGNWLKILNVSKVAAL